MNIKRFKREVNDRQDEFTVLWARRDDLTKTLHVCVRPEIQAPPALLVSKLKEKYRVKKAKDFMESIKPFIYKLKPKVKRLKIHVQASK